MKFLSKVASILALTAISSSAMAASIYPSFGFVQEMAGVAANGDISADFYNTTGYPTHLRIGAFKGEIMIDPSIGVAATGMGYKYPINPHIGIYGKLYLNSGGGTSITNLTLGGAYTGNSGDFTYNGNAEVFSCSNCVAGTSETFLKIKGAGFYRLKTNKLGGKMSIGAEVDLQLSPSPTTTDLYAGLRWQPKSKLIVDAGLASSTGGTTTLGTPAFVRLTLGL
jgi:hypothetical protein